MVPIRVAVAARSALRRMALEDAMRASAEFELVRTLEWSDVTAAEYDADVVVLDAGHTQIDNLPAISMSAIILIDTAEIEQIRGALRLGYRGVLSSPVQPVRLRAAVRAVAAGLIVTSDGAPSPLFPVEALSDREIEVLGLLAEGLSNKLIALRLHISEHTVKTHVSAIMSKLRASSRTEAVTQGIRRGLVTL